MQRVLCGEMGKTVRAIVATHFMSDHIAGMKLFPEALTIAHRHYRHTFLSQNRRVDAFYRDPRVLFDATMSLRRGRHALRLVHNPGKTLDQVSVDVPTADLVCTGDTIVGNIVYLSRADPELIRGAIDGMRQFGRATAVGGHIGRFPAATLDNHFDATAVADALGKGEVLVHPAGSNPRPLPEAARAWPATAWEPQLLGDFTATAVPASDGYGDPQASWVVSAGGRRIFHGGDTLWHGHWWRIGRQFGPFDAAFLPVNGVHFGWRKPVSGQPGVLTPEQAVAAAAIILGAPTGAPPLRRVGDGGVRRGRGPARPAARCRPAQTGRRGVGGAGGDYWPEAATPVLLVRPRFSSRGSILGSWPAKSRNSFIASWLPPCESRVLRKWSPLARVSPPLSLNHCTLLASSTSDQM